MCERIQLLHYQDKDNKGDRGGLIMGILQGILVFLLVSLSLFVFFVAGPPLLYLLIAAWEEWREIFKRGD